MEVQREKINGCCSAENKHTKSEGNGVVEGKEQEKQSRRGSGKERKSGERR